DPERVAVTEHLRDRPQELELGVTVPHLDLCALPRIGAEQVGLRMLLLDEAADRHGLAQDAAVGQLEDRQQRDRVLAAKLFGLVCGVRDQHLDRVVRHVLLRQEDAHPARIRRAGVVVQEHAEDFSRSTPKNGKARADLVQSTGMRIVGILVVLCLSAGLGGCKNKGDADAAPDPEAVKAQQELIARRDKLLEARRKLQSDKDKLDAEIAEIQAKGGDATEQLKKKAELDAELESQNESLLALVNSKVDAIGKAADKTAQVAAREADLASRERSVAEREARLAERERALAVRDAESAARWKESCSVGAPTIIQAASPKDGKYTKSDVSALIRKAKRAMAKKGLINSDLPG